MSPEGAGQPPVGADGAGARQGEIYACAMTSVYTFGPTFRAENSVSVEDGLDGLRGGRGTGRLHVDRACPEGCQQDTTSDTSRFRR